MPKHGAGKRAAERVPIKWSQDVAAHDYRAAHDYLSLKVTEVAAQRVVNQLRAIKPIERRANDILRAAGMTAAPLEDQGVVKELIKAVEGKALSPVLVVAGVGGTEIADGFHRVSFAYRVDPYGVVPLKLVVIDRGAKDV